MQHGSCETGHRLSEHAECVGLRGVPRHRVLLAIERGDHD